MRYRVWTILGVACLLATLTCGGMALAAQRDPTAERATWLAAKERWNARGPSSYRMLLEESSCTTEYQVREDRVAWGYETPCGRRGRTVSSLFTIIEEYARLEPVCVGNGCPCKRVTTLDVRYDPELGFPAEIAIHVRHWPNWQSSAFWQAALDTRSNPCGKRGGRVITVMGLFAN